MIKKAISQLVLGMVIMSISFANDTTYVDTSTASDTILYIPRDIEGTVYGAVDSVDYERRLTQNPTLALFKSLIVPGLGQIGNRQYIKAVVVIGLESWLITSAVRHGSDASDLHKQFIASNDIAERNLLYDQYLDSKDQRNKYTWFAVIVTFVSMFDAYSDAHLSGFPKENKSQESALDFDIKPTVDAGVYASISFSF